MTIIKVHKYDSPFVQIDKRPINDDRLSWKAKGMLAYLLSKPPDWTVRVNDLVKRSKDGRDAVLSGLKELEKIGYIVRFQERLTGGRFGPVEYHVYELPQTEKPVTDKPETDKPETEKPTHSNNELIDNELIDNDISNISPADAGTEADTNRAVILAELQDHFCNATALKVPLRQNIKQQKAAAVRWDAPLLHIARQANGPDVTRGSLTGACKRAITAAVEHMNREKLPIATPQSIEKVAVAKLARAQSSGVVYDVAPVPAPDNATPKSPARDAPATDQEGQVLQLALEYLKAVTTPAVYDARVRPCVFVFADGRLDVTGPPVAIEWNEAKLSLALAAAWENASGETVRNIVFNEAES